MDIEKNYLQLETYYQKDNIYKFLHQTKIT